MHTLTHTPHTSRLSARGGCSFSLLQINNALTQLPSKPGLVSRARDLIPSSIFHPHYQAPLQRSIFSPTIIFLLPPPSRFPSSLSGGCATPDLASLPASRKSTFRSKIHCCREKSSRASRPPWDREKGVEWGSPRARALDAFSDVVDACCCCWWAIGCHFPIQGFPKWIWSGMCPLRVSARTPRIVASALTNNGKYW